MKVSLLVSDKMPKKKSTLFQIQKSGFAHHLNLRTKGVFFFLYYQPTFDFQVFFNLHTIYFYSIIFLQMYLYLYMLHQ